MRNCLWLCHLVTDFSWRRDQWECTSWEGLHLCCRHPGRLVVPRLFSCRASQPINGTCHITWLTKQLQSRKFTVIIRYLINNVNTMIILNIFRFIKIIQKIQPSGFNFHLAELWNRGRSGYVLLVSCFTCNSDLRIAICCMTPLITITTVPTGRFGILSQRSAGRKTWPVFEDISDVEGCILFCWWHRVPMQGREEQRHQVSHVAWRECDQSLNKHISTFHSVWKRPVNLTILNHFLIW